MNEPGNNWQEYTQMEIPGNNWQELPGNNWQEYTQMEIPGNSGFTKVHKRITIIMPFYVLLL